MTDVPALQQAFEFANQANLSSEELEDLEHREMFIHDQRNALKLAHRRGIEQGIEQGIERGREAERQQIAKQMKTAGMPIAQIAAITGLPVEAIETL